MTLRKGWSVDKEGKEESGVLPNFHKKTKRCFMAAFGEDVLFVGICKLISGFTLQLNPQIIVQF